MAKENGLLKNYQLALVDEAIRHERKALRPIKAIVLSRFNYDKLVSWLEKMGVINEDNYQYETLSWKKVDIKRCDSGMTQDMRVEYFETKDVNSVTKTMEENMKLFGINKSYDNILTKEDYKWAPRTKK